MTVNRELPCYAVLQRKIDKLLNTPGVTLGAILHRLTNDSDINWDAIQKNEKTNAQTWETMAKHWKLGVIKLLIPQNTFPNGGDRVSPMIRGQRQKAIIEYSRQNALAAPRNEDDDSVADRCVNQVMQRWHSKNMDVIGRVVRSITRTVRRQSRNGEENCDGLDDFELAEVFEAQVIEDVTVTSSGAPNLASLGDCLMQLPPVERIQAVLKWKELEVEAARVETARVAAEAAHVDAMHAVERIRAQGDADVARIRATGEADVARMTASRKRPALPLQEDDERLAALSARPFRGRVSLSARVWEARPSECKDDLRTVYQRLSDSAVTLGVPGAIRRAMNGVAGIELVFVDAGAPVRELVDAFWNGSDQPAPAQPPRIAAPPRRTGRPLPEGMHDLAAAVIEEPPDSAAYLAAVRRLDSGFCAATAERWAVLWPPRPNNPRLLLTYIDVARDPVVPQLREWLRRDSEDPAPTYPATGVVDLRPSEEVPPALRAMDPDVWPLLQASGLERACAKMLSAYHRSQGQPVPAADAPCDERLRQFRRLTPEGVEELTYRQLADCLGWLGATGDTLLVKGITEALMQSPLRRSGPVPAASWYVKRGNCAFWRWRICLREMRTAAVFVTRLRLGGADLSFLARDIANFGPRPLKQTN